VTQSRDIVKIITRNLASLRARIEAACKRAGRDPAGVTLIAVTKYHGVEVMEAVAAAGLQDIGENRLQVAEPKLMALKAKVRRHFIGPLQTNKTKRVLELFDIIHSLDRLALADVIDKRAVQAGRATVGCFVEVNTSGEASKSGLAPSQLIETLEEIRQKYHRIELLGLMTMAAQTEDAGRVRASFQRLRELRDEAVANGKMTPAFGGLSMGMSGDFEIAIEEGATHIRIGTALYEGLPESSAGAG